MVVLHKSIFVTKVELRISRSDRSLIPDEVTIATLRCFSSVRISSTIGYNTIHNHFLIYLDITQSQKLCSVKV